MTLMVRKKVDDSTHGLEMLERVGQAWFDIGKKWMIPMAWAYRKELDIHGSERE
jgi:hypothetical protein